MLLHFSTFLLTVGLLFPPLTYAQKPPLRMAVMSDMHYLSLQLMDDGEAVKRYEQASAKNVRWAARLFTQALDSIVADGADVLLISGDLTKDGERKSHLEVAQRLNELHQRGVRVFVVPGNHDVNVPRPVAFSGMETIPADNISPADFAEIYKHCGYGDALARDTASLSYVARLDDQTWLLCLDSNRYREHTTSTITAGRILPDTERWALSILQKARTQKVRVMAMMHHGLVEHFPMQSLLFGNYLVNDWQRLATWLADEGVQVVFTGHFHANDITAFRSTAGNVLYDVETGSLSSYPFPFRQMLWDGQRLSISTRLISSLPDVPHLAKQDSIAKFHFAKQMARGKVKERLSFLSDEVVSRLAELIATVFIAHVAGDEKMTTEMTEAIKKFADFMENDAENPSNEWQPDFAPADNNVVLELLPPS